MTEKLYNLKETADILRVTRQTIYNKLKKGEIKAAKIGREYRVTETEINRLIHGKKS